MALVNMMEYIVDEKLRELLADVDCCKCEKCLIDMKAFALNNLKPMYVNSREGELYSLLDSTKIQNLADINVAVVNAINVVKREPHHAQGSKQEFTKSAAE